MVSLLLSTLPILFIIYLFLRPKKTLPPGPPGLPLIGNLHRFTKTPNLHTYLWNLSGKYGPIMHINLGSLPLVVISSAKLSEHVLKTHDSTFCSRPSHFVGLRKLTYNLKDIAFSPYNDYWREVRKISAIHLFSQRKIQSFGPIREGEIACMVAKIEGASDHQAGVNLSEMVMDLTVSMICRVAFGKKYEENGSEKSRFYKVLRDFQAAMATVYASDYFPMLGSWVDKLRGVMDRLDATAKEMDLFYQELINEHLCPDHNMKKNVEEDVLDVLIRLKQQTSALTWDHIKALLMNIFVGGTDTNAASIIWVMTTLIKAPKIMKKVQTEIREIIGKKGKVEEEDLNKLSYLRAVIYETFRLYPSVPLLLPRETMGKCMLGGYEIQPKTMVYINVWAVGRDPEYWENPDEFLPERFLNTSADVIKGQDFGLKVKD